MKLTKISAILLSTVMIVLALMAFAPKENRNTVGGWKEVKDGTITPELQEIFDQAMEGFTGVNYTPIVLLETQLVSGTNYRFLCESQVVVPDGKKGQEVVTVYKDLQGNVRIIDIVDADEQSQ